MRARFSRPGHLPKVPAPTIALDIRISTYELLGGTTIQTIASYLQWELPEGGSSTNGETCKESILTVKARVPRNLN